MSCFSYQAQLLTQMVSNNYASFNQGWDYLTKLYNGKGGCEGIEGDCRCNPANKGPGNLNWIKQECRLEGLGRDC